MTEVHSAPFAPVTQVDMAFGHIPNMWEAIEACPKEFFSNSFQGYQLLANDLFAHFAGWHSMTQGQIDEMNQNTDRSKYSEEKWLYVQTWLRSFAPKHEQKQAVVAWCLSLMMKAPPPYTKKRPL